MASYKVKDKKKTPKKLSRKIVGIVLLTISCFFLFCLLTTLIGFMNSFLLGTFGIFAYPLSMWMFVYGVALVNGKRYRPTSKAYVAFLILSIIFLLCIIQMGVIGPANELTFGQHLALSYTKKWTGGGIIIGLLTTSLTYLMGYVWAYVIISIIFAVFLALFIDRLIHIIKANKNDKPVKISLKEVKKKEDINVVLQGNREEKEREERLSQASVGLTRRAPVDYEKKIESEVVKSEKKSILTPPEIDFEKYFSSNKNSTPTISVAQVNKNIREMKESPEQIVHSEDYTSFSRQTIKRGNLPEIKPEEVVDEVDEIIQGVVQETIKENPELATQSTEETPKDSFRRESFSRESAMPTRESLPNRETIPTRENSIAREGGMDRRRFVDFDRREPKEEEQEEVDPPYHYTRPPVELLTTESTDMSEMGDDVAEKTIILENTLQEFGVAARVQEVLIGPAVTRYEIEMPSGVTVNRVLNLKNDIALALEANGDIRIEAPVVGKNVVGIEVPNKKVATVGLRDVIDSPEFNASKSPLSFSVGKDITGAITVGELNKMPHLLIAGTTGSGKSVMLNGIILSLIYKASPEDVKLILVDPKQVEFRIYEGIPHLLTPKVLTDVSKAANALQWAVDEMERRFRLIGDANVRTVEEYNQTEAVLNKRKKKLPYIVIIIDEFSDFMMTSKKEVEDKIVRIGQKARSAGIHMILATQRPTIECVTGGIKANFPSRIAFKVAGRVNSDVILGQSGAENLLGRGDMLYAPQEFSADPKRIQGCFVTTAEVNNIVQYTILNNEQRFDPAIQDAINNTPRNNMGGDDRGMDPMLPEALKIVIEANQASSSMLQRKLSIGWPRAAKIVDQMADLGYISASDGTSKPRTVYITLEEYYQIFGDKYN